MTGKQFRWILCFYCIIVAGSFVAGELSGSMVPETVRDLEATLAVRAMPSFLRGAVIVIVFGGGLTGLIGMFSYWGPSRYIFFVAVAAKVLLAPWFLPPWTADTVWSGMFGELELFLDGAILVLCLFGPAKGLFDKEQKN